ncbi:MAG TPA: hypothetical protein VE987_04200 [Polyangiaceae bacterium]|nr:hypothetical protein [Polyangiaceae bacterium]
MKASVVLAGVLATSPLSAEPAPIATWQSPYSGFVSAQPSTSPLVSNVQLTAPWLRGEPTGPAGLGNTIDGFAVQRFASIRLTRAFTLQGFSRAGCPVDGAISAGCAW